MSSSVAFLQREEVIHRIQSCSIEHEMLSFERARSTEVLKNVIARDTFDTILAHKLLLIYGFLLDLGHAFRSLINLLKKSAYFLRFNHRVDLCNSLLHT